MNKPNEMLTQNRLMDIINDNPLPDNEIEIFSFTTDRTEIIHQRESNYAFLELIKPLIQGNNVLDIFCGTNSIKQFSEQNHLATTVTGVDNGNNSHADINCNVENLPDILTLSNQFDIVTSFGGTESENYSDDYNYLKSDGLLIHGYSDTYFNDNNIESQLNPDDKTKKDTGITDLLKYFKPIAIIKIQQIHQIIDWPNQNEPIDLTVDMVYLIFGKNPIRQTKHN